MPKDHTPRPYYWGEQYRPESGQFPPAWDVNSPSTLAVLADDIVTNGRVIEHMEVPDLWELIIAVQDHLGVLLARTTRDNGGNFVRKGVFDKRGQRSDSAATLISIIGGEVSRCDYRDIDDFDDLEIGCSLKVCSRFLGQAWFREVHFNADVEFSVRAVLDQDKYWSAFRDVSFDSAFFIGTARFDHAVFGGEAHFESACFMGESSFYSARFGGDARFGSSRFESGLQFDSAIFNQYALFNGVRFGGWSQFTSVNFHNDVDFDSAEFVEIANFDNAIFDKNALFNSVDFNNDARFEFACFFGNVQFNRSRFEEKANFNNTAFNMDTSFKSVKFNKEAGFVHARFAGDASFVFVHFMDNARFASVSFGLFAAFGSVCFGGDADFRGVSFNSEALFDSVVFEGDAVFCPATISDVISFSKSTINRSLIFSNWEESAEFSSDHPRLVLDGFVVRPGANIQMSKRQVLGLACQDSTTNKDDIGGIRSGIRFYSQLYDVFDQQLSMSELRDICNYQYLGLLSRSRWLEKKALSKEAGWRSFLVGIYWFLYIIDNCVNRYMLGYLIYTKRILLTGACVIALWARFYALGHSACGLQYAGWHEHPIVNPIYFSVVTFTSLGYGDIQPTSVWMKAAAASEALIGLALMALFIVAWARKMVR